MNKETILIETIESGYEYWTHPGGLYQPLREYGIPEAVIGLFVDAVREHQYASTRVQGLTEAMTAEATKINKAVVDGNHIVTNIGFIGSSLSEWLAKREFANQQVRRLGGLIWDLRQIPA